MPSIHVGEFQVPTIYVMILGFKQTEFLYFFTFDIMSRVTYTFDMVRTPVYAC